MISILKDILNQMKMGSPPKVSYNEPIWLTFKIEDLSDIGTTLTYGYIKSNYFSQIIIDIYVSVSCLMSMSESILNSFSKSTYRISFSIF
jgi:hypothetical protein